MITNWGAHHFDIVQWAMGQELGGPMTIEARANFMKDDAWTVHVDCHVEMLYPNQVTVITDNTFDNGIRFEGEDGWVFCARGAVSVTASDPKAAPTQLKPLEASDPKILLPLGPNDSHRWMESPDHYQNWVESVIANRDPIAPVDQAARSVQACRTAWIAMKLKRKLTWDAAKECFVNDDEAKALCARKPRSPEYDFKVLMKNAGI